MRMRTFVVAVVAALALCALARAADIQELWVYMAPNFNSDADTDNVIAVLQQAKPLGVTHLNLKDPKLGYLTMMPPRYFENVERAKAAAKEAGITLIPTVYPFGYSGGYLMHDANLSAGLPVKDAVFVVKGAKALPDPSAAPAILNPSFEETRDGSVTAWQINIASTASNLDKEIKHSGAACLKFFAPPPSPVPEQGEGMRRSRQRPVRPTQKLKVEPFKYYRLTFWGKSDALQADNEGVVEVSSARRRHNFTNITIPPTSDWTQYQVTFNTLEAAEIDLSVAAMPQAGTFWLDDVTIEPAGLANLLRTQMKPFVVKSADGKTVYEEGKDFKPVADPLLGNMPGDDIILTKPYDIWHEGPAIELTDSSRIKDGDRLLVSYFHPHFIYNDQLIIAMDEPRVYELMEDQVKRVTKLFGAPGYMMNYDEIRIAGWEIHPDGSNPSPGEILAENVKRGVEIFKKYAPDATLYTWSDMFTPFHNARPLGERGYYYLIDGDWDKSWVTLPGTVVIAQWAARDKQAMMWFAGRGNKQILCGYYDSPELKGNISRWMRLSDGVPGVIGMMYTTWKPDYQLMPEFFKLVKSWPAWAAEVPERERFRER